MFLKKITLGLTAGALTLALAGTSHAGDAPVDFGDSGIEIVVTPDGDESKVDGMETELAYWFPDEFWDFYPGFDWFPGIPAFPGWGDGGKGPEPDPCATLAAQRDALQQIYDDLLAEFTQAIEGGSLVFKDPKSGKERVSTYPSSGWVARMYQLTRDLAELRDQLGAFDDALADCGCK